jgi:hypothetical protein
LDIHDLAASPNDRKPDTWTIRRLVCHLCLLWRKRAKQYTQILHINIEDVLVTREIISAGKLLDIDVLDRAPCKCA